jgi:hypothetical protein
MIDVQALWLPILVSSVIVFVASWVLHMAPTWHKTDYPKLANEDRLMDAVRPLGIAPGNYMVPRPADHRDMRSPEFAEKMKKGPVMMLTVMPSGPVNMGSSLLRWFVFVLVVGVFVAYITSRALAAGAPYLRVFQIAGATAFIAYSMALWPMRIWYGRSLGMTIKENVDGLIYGLLTAGAFGWLWPH